MNNNLKISFDHIKLLEMNGQSRKSFNGNYTIYELNHILVKEWIPFRSCCSCGKNDYCKFYVQSDEDHQCGVVKKALKNYLEKSFYEVIDSTLEEKQGFLDALFFFCKYVLESEQINGILINQEIFKQHGWDLKAYSLMIPSIRETLNDFSKSLKILSQLYKKTSVLLVEGQSEMIFINNLRGNESTFRVWNFLIDSYYGKSNKTRTKLKILLDKYKEIGYHIYLQGDEDGNGDGSGYDKFIDFTKKGYNPKENIFQFKYDFESAIPKKTVYNFLIENSLLKNESFIRFNSKVKEGPINDILLEEYGINMKKNRLKKRMAKYVGRFYFVLPHKEIGSFKESELGKFVDFLNKIE